MLHNIINIKIIYTMYSIQILPHYPNDRDYSIKASSNKDILQICITATANNNISYHIVPNIIYTTNFYR